MRAQYRKGKISEADYEAFLEKETARVVRWQDEVGLDVLVHGEFERTDMVEYFGEQLSGFVFTENGWVQSYGSRCVKPPILFGDVARPEPMTVRWSKFAQAQTKKPMKGMLTGPITILQWSFVRDDQARAETARQIALAIRDEVQDLEAAGISVIQVDEPALREGLPCAGPTGRSICAGRSTRSGCDGGRGGPDSDSHAHVLLRVQRDHRGDRGAGCGRDLDRELALGDGAAGGISHLQLSERSWAGHLGHSFAARAVGGRNGRLLEKALQVLPRSRSGSIPTAALRHVVGPRWRSPEEYGGCRAEDSDG